MATKDISRLFWQKKKFTYAEERAHLTTSIRQFLDGTGGAWDWDDFISIPIKHQDLAAIQGFCRSLPIRFPPRTRTEWCNPEGWEELRIQLERWEAEDTSPSFPPPTIG